jgi:probable phosphoglycerate mutase
MLRVLLVRHGETEWNRERRIMGREDIGLNENGREHSRQTREALKNAPIDAVYCSPIARARETAEILCEGRGLEPLYDARLEEVDYGDWAGMTFVEARSTPGYIPYFDRLDTPVAPQGETLYEVRDRGLDFLNGLRADNDEGTILVVSHAEWIKCIVMHTLDIPFNYIWRIRIDNGSITVLELDPAGDRVACLNQRDDFDRIFVRRLSF